MDTIVINRIQAFRYLNACEGRDVAFAIGSVMGVDSVLWDFGDQRQGRGLNTTHRYDTVGTYLVKSLIFFSGKTDTLVKNMEIIPVPVVNLGEDVTIGPNTLLTLDAGMYDFPVNYIWDDRSTFQYRYINGKYLSAGTHHFYVTVYSRVNYCASSDTIDVTLKELVQADFENTEVNIRAYPNPVNTSIFIDIPGSETIHVTISNTGGSIYGKQILVPGMNELNVSELKAGLYVFRLTKAGNLIGEIKVIKQ
jgi:PKD repeat protein